MSIIDALLLGIVQGLTEFIPVSSSGHLVLMQQWLGVTELGLTFDVALHLGTLCALLLHFRRDIADILRETVKGGKKRKLGMLLGVATIPAVVAGVLLQETAETTFRSTKLVAINMIVIAIIMLMAERFAQRYQKKVGLGSVRPWQAVAVGFAQALALVPGVSRSGATITAGIFSGFDRVAATRFSFLLGIPIMVGALSKVMLFDEGISAAGREPALFFVGVLSAFASGLLAIRFLLRYLSKHSLNIFAYYRIALGLIALLLFVA